MIGHTSMKLRIEGSILRAYFCFLVGKRACQLASVRLDR